MANQQVYQALQNSVAQGFALKKQREAEEKKRQEIANRNVLGSILGTAGAAIGGMIGGPAGAAIGGSLGSALGTGKVDTQNIQSTIQTQLNRGIKLEDIFGGGQ